jgi:UDP-glucose:(heptosyl)LPS alpha-1,3-glucosyltransferase
MKLAIVRRRYNPFGGAERFIERLVPALSARGVQVSLITEHWKHESTQFRVINAPSNGITRTARFESFARSVNQVIHRESIGGLPFDLIQSHERMLGVNIFRAGDGVHAAWLSRLQREAGRLKSLLLRVDPFHRTIIELEKQMAADPRIHFVANSRLIAEEIQEYLAVSDRRVSFIPNGIDTDRFSPPTDNERVLARSELKKLAGFEITRDTFVVLSVGSGFARKGVFQLIDACSRMSETVLIIVGSDKETTRAREQIEQLGASTKIVLTGPLHDIRSILRSCDAFCLPSLYEPSSNAVLEALSCGVPVVITKNVGMANEIKEAGAGLLCGRNPDSIIEALAAIRSVECRSAIRAKCRAYALHFRQDLIADQWSHLYDSVRQLSC